MNTVLIQQDWNHIANRSFTCVQQRRRKGKLLEITIMMPYFSTILKRI